MGTEIGMVILQERQGRGLSQDQVYDLTGIDQTTQSKYETGKRIPSKKTVIRLAGAFGGSTRLLLAVCGTCEIAAAIMRTLSMPRDDQLQIQQFRATTIHLLDELHKLEKSAPQPDSSDYVMYVMQVSEIMKKLSLEAKAHALSFGSDSL